MVRYSGVTNSDLSFQAYNNLLRGGQWFTLEPIPASAGNWLLEDNLFDKVDFFQDTTLPLDFDFNGYWPKQASELLSPGYDAGNCSPRQLVMASPTARMNRF